MKMKQDARERLDALSPAKRALMQKLLERPRTGADGPAPIEPRPPGEAPPLSYAQQRLWFLNQLEGPSATYNMGGALRLRGPLDARALGRALDEIVQRHEVVRTRFAAKDGMPVQIVAPTVDYDREEVSLEALPEQEQEIEVLRRAEEHLQRPFDLAEDTLLRTTLLRLGPDAHVLLLSVHHIAADGWSIAVFFRELCALYEAHAKGRPGALPPLPFQYADYASWQRRWLTRERLAPALAHWRARLKDPPAPLDLPSDRPRPPVQTFRGRKLRFHLDRALQGALSGLCRETGATLFMVLLSAFAAVLSRYGRTRDLVIGSPVANRQREELERLIGLFVNTLALRVDLGGRPTGRELIARVREACLADFTHKDLPFELLVEELKPERSLSHSPLFQVMFVLQNAQADEERLADLRVSITDPETRTSMFDLTLFIQEQPDGLAGTVEYSTDLFDEATIARFVAHYRTLLAALAARPDRRVSELSLLDATEEARCLVAWNRTGVAHEGPATVLALFEDQAARTPDAIACRFEGQSLTYRALAGRARALAAHLRHLGVGPGALAAIFLDRSLDLLVALLGVMGAGAAYVPLDPALPRDRLAFMLEDAGPRVVVTEQRLAGTLPEGSARRVVLDRDRAEIEGAPAEPLHRVEAGDRAYVIYTSGSTGRPKGVEVTHGALGNLLRAMAREPGLGPGDRLLAVTTISFDIAGLELYLPLSVGASVEILPREVAADGLRLRAAIERSGATCMQATPATYVALLEADALPGTLRKILCGGEALPRALAERLLQGGAEVWNLYGPTETTIWSAAARLSPAPRDGRDGRGGEAACPIGRPIDNTQIYLLDDEGRPAPIGVPGELHIGGAGLALGYLNRPGLTAERFVPDPFSAAPGARLYRTGDLARFRPDGAIEFRGRTDQQIKLRGHRIELGEIEAAIAQHPAIKASAVACRDAGLAEKELVAYLVEDTATAAAGDAHAELGGAPDPLAGRRERALAESVREHLARRLPAYMVPATYVRLDALPLTPNGKVDRGALPAPDRLAHAQEHVAPATDDERRLARIWAEVLGVGRVGATDDFFELGGHSLRATQVASRIRDAFAIELPLRCLFEARTVRSLAVELGARGRPPPRAAPPPVRRAAAAGPAPLSFSQQRLWFLSQLEGPSATYNLFGSLRLRGAIDAAALGRALDEIVRRHEVLRTRIVEVDGEAAQVASGEARCPLAIEDAGGEAGARARAAALAHEPFDLAAGPPIRALLARIGERDHALVIAAHHVAADEWSIRIFLRELGLLYGAFARGEASPLAELDVQYVDYARWQRAWLAGEVLARELGYWRERLAGAPRALALRTDRPRPKVQSFRGRTRRFELDAELTARLRELGRARGATLFMTLLSGFAALLSRYSGQRDLVIGTPIANRTRTETEHLIGFFVNTLALRIDLGGDPSAAELVDRVRAVSLEAQDHQDVPFESLVEELRVERDLGRAPLFQVMFVLQNGPLSELDLGGIEVSELEIDARVARFDLTLSMEEAGGALRAGLEYSTALFDDATAERMVERLRALFAAMAARPGVPVGRLPMIPDAERVALLEGARGALIEGALAGPETVHALFSEQARRTPAATAVLAADEALSYAELDRRSDHLAARLAAAGVGPEVLVALLVERPVEQVVGLLAILKAGGAYLPVDPRYPGERINFLLADSRAPVILTERHLAATLPAWSAGRDPASAGPSGVVVLIDVDPAPEREREATRAGGPRAAALPDNLAYVIYTSGSTGKPKGAGVSHRALCNLARDQAEQLALDEGSRLLQLASLSFDVATSDIAMALVRGATLCVCAPEERAPGPGLVELLAERRVTHVQFPASLLAVLPERDLPDLRVLVVGGEPCPMDVVQRWRSGRRVYNAYGPTETTVAAMIGEIRPGDPVVHLGRPLANTRAYVLDPHLEPAPTGVAGELYIGGVQLARGYLGQPALTAERFLPDPHAPEPGARMYRTGDLARVREDHLIEFLGRADHQVKVRGVRVELGEVEAALSSHPSVKACVVVAREDEPGGATEKRLVAYVVPGEGECLPGALREHLRARLPEPMVPSAFVVLAALPRSPHGKVDRGALPRYEAPAEGLVPPRDDVEAALVRVLGEVLGHERVSVHHHFFDDLGGSSLAMVRAARAASSALGVEVPVVRFFEHPTAAALARALSGTTEAAPVLRTASERAHSRDAILRARRGARKKGTGDG
ncbi:amino acid adenylation domain-containing protein [Sorangium sp. So ce1389]|uniref:amino acid adenylation domain-containing protein n=1 Tax=Sorangium sp. So ce1389 TaxID=3133336 RepID=UPI003F5FF65A